MVKAAKKCREGMCVCVWLLCASSHPFTVLLMIDTFIFLLLQCPQCNRTCGLRDVRKIFASRIAAVDDDAHKVRY